MAKPRAWLAASRRWILSFVLVLLVPAAAVVRLGVRLIEQDRALASRQLRERRKSAADRLAQMASARPVPIRLGGECLSAECLALTPFDTARVVAP